MAIDRVLKVNRLGIKYGTGERSRFGEPLTRKVLGPLFGM